MDAKRDDSRPPVVSIQDYRASGRAADPWEGYAAERRLQEAERARLRDEHAEEVARQRRARSTIAPCDPWFWLTRRTKLVRRG